MYNRILCGSFEEEEEEEEAQSEIFQTFSLTLPKKGKVFLSEGFDARLIV